MIKKIVVFFLLILISVGFLFCQNKKHEISALKTDKPPLIDRILNEDIWQSV